MLAGDAQSPLAFSVVDFLKSWKCWRWALRLLSLFLAPMLDPLTTAEIQALRLQLHHFGSQQQDPVVLFYCLEVESILAEALERDDPMLREVLASSVEQLEKTLRSGRAE